MVYNVIEVVKKLGASGAYYTAYCNYYKCLFRTHSHTHGLHLTKENYPYP